MSAHRGHDHVRRPALLRRVAAAPACERPRSRADGPLSGRQADEEKEGRQGAVEDAATGSLGVHGAAAASRLRPPRWHDGVTGQARSPGLGLQGDHLAASMRDEPRGRGTARDASGLQKEPQMGALMADEPTDSRCEYAGQIASGNRPARCDLPWTGQPRGPMHHGGPM